MMIQLRCITAVVVAAIAARGTQAQEATRPAASQPASAPAGLPVSLAGFADEGTFYLFVNEERLVTIETKWKSDGSLESTHTMAVGGQSVTRKMEITPDADGRWKRISVDSPLGPITLERDGTTATRTIKEKTDTLEMKAGTVLFENMTPALMTLAVRQYDQAKGGKQTFPLFIVPSIVMEGSLEAEEPATRNVGGRDVRFARYKYGLPGVDLHLWVDSAGKVCLGDVPAQHAAYVRQGYEELRKPAGADAAAAAAQEITVDSNVSVPMRDGVQLATDIYRPAGDGKFPVILIRTPYQKDMVELKARYFARRSYAVAVQDCRGRFRSAGTWEPFMHEGDDGYDTIEWLAAQPWSTGKVGMIGGSYLGWVQWWAASRNPPHLVTIIPNVAPPDPFYNIPYEYGTFFLLGAIWWADVLESEATADLSGAAMSQIGEKKYAKLLSSLPVIDLDKAVLGKENRYWRAWIAHPINDEFWTPANFLDRLEKVNIPVFHQSGWFDGDGIGSKLNYLKMRSCGHPYQKLVLGPWGHTDTAMRRAGDRDFGEAAIIDLQEQYLRWLDHWLKDVDNGIEQEPLVSLFVMGTNRWLHGSEYPLPQTQLEKWYLTSAGHANTSRGDGRLSTSAPPADMPPDRYTYDPANPTPQPDYHEETEEEEARVRSVDEKKAEAEAHHEQVTQARADILVYVSEPLKEPLTICGPVSAVLYASSSARDTDWFVRLLEVEESGKLFPLVEGRLRARYRTSTHEPELLEPGKTYEYPIDMWQTGITIPAGRRVRVEVASASFPVFSRNLNTGGHNEVETEFIPAQQTIYHSARYPSHVLLPVIPESSADAAHQSPSAREGQ
jgi:putative CocE/NonD family hydrolase